jgi:hypothetical protein
MFREITVSQQKCSNGKIVNFFLQCVCMEKDRGILKHILVSVIRLFVLFWSVIMNVVYSTRLYMIDILVSVKHLFVLFWYVIMNVVYTLIYI